jgi:hypothetical protein
MRDGRFAGPPSGAQLLTAAPIVGGDRTSSPPGALSDDAERLCRLLSCLLDRGALGRVLRDHGIDEADVRVGVVVVSVHEQKFEACTAKQGGEPTLTRLVARPPRSRGCENSRGEGRVTSVANRVLRDAEWCHVHHDRNRRTKG